MFPEVTCKPKKLANGGFGDQKVWRAGEKINFTCNHGYRLEGRRSDVCKKSGRWRHRDLPFCTRMYCVPMYIFISLLERFK